MSDAPDRPSRPGYEAGPEPAPTDPLPAPPGSRWPALALFVGGFLTCLGLVLSGLALTGTIRPLTVAGGAGSAATPSPRTSGAGGSAAPTVTLPALVTPAPIVKPAYLTPTALADGNALGKAGAGVTVEVWEDYQCPYCQRFTVQTEPQIIENYVTTGKVRLVYRDLAFLGDESYWASVAAALARQQGKFWPYHDYLFANQLGENVGSYSVARLQLIADAVGLDRRKFDAGLQLDAARTLFAQIKQASDADATRLGITSTPTVVVAGKVVEGSDWTTVKAAIDAALAAG